MHKGQQHLVRLYHLQQQEKQTLREAKLADRGEESEKHKLRAEKDEGDQQGEDSIKWFYNRKKQLQQQKPL